MIIALAGVAQLIGRHPANLKVTSSTPGQGTCLGCGFIHVGERARGNRCFSPFLNPSLPLSLEEIYFKKEDYAGVGSIQFFPYEGCS